MPKCLSKLTVSGSQLIQKLPAELFICIHLLWDLHIVSGTIILALPRMGFANFRACAIKLFATFMALRKMLITFRIGTIDHLGSDLSAIAAFRNNNRVNRIHRDGHPVIKNITVSFKILSSNRLTIFNYSAMQLVNFFKAFM